MKIAVPKETRPGERRVALVPESCKKLVQAGYAVAVEAGAGASAHFRDEAYVQAGATIESDAAALLGSADFVCKVAAPTAAEVGSIRPGAFLLGTLMPLRNLDIAEALAERKVTAFSTDAIPRTTRAQAMDTLSSTS